MSNLLKNHKNQLLKKFKREKYIHHLKMFGGADLADMKLISKYDEGICFLWCCIIDIFLNKMCYNY